MGLNQIEDGSSMQPGESAPPERDIVIEMSPEDKVALLEQRATIIEHDIGVQIDLLEEQLVSTNNKQGRATLLIEIRTLRIEQHARMHAVQQAIQDTVRAQIKATNYKEFRDPYDQWTRGYYRDLKQRPTETLKSVTERQRQLGADRRKALGLLSSTTNFFAR